MDILVTNSSESLQGGQEVHLGVAEGSDNPKGVLLLPVSWSDSDLREFHAVRLGAIAKLTGLRVVGIDYPGMGDLDGGRRDGLTEKQIEEAKAGRMHNLAETYWTALEMGGVLVGDDGQKLPIAFWGHSLASLTVAELVAQTPEGHDITDIHFSEIMALRKELIGPFALRFILKGPYEQSAYLGMNRGMPEHGSNGLFHLGKQVVIQRQSHGRTVQTLARGKHIEVTHEGFRSGRIAVSHDSGTQLTVVRAGKGLVRPEEHELYIGYLRRPFGDRVVNCNVSDDILDGVGHAYQDSLPAVLDQASRLAIIGV